MNLEQLIFTWKGRHLVIALFASIKFNLSVIRIDVSKYPETFTCSNLTIEIIGEGVQYVQS